MPKERRDTANAADGEANFVAFVYKDDYRKIQELVQEYPNIETGGDLFGLWEDERTVVIQLFIGPGKKSVRTTTSFHQDVEYLHRVGSLITTEEGLCNVGEWHSHHQIGMPEPSAADRRTVFNNMPHLGLERFVLFIASIESDRSEGKTKKRPRDVQPKQVVLRSFLFLGPTQEVLHGDIKIIPGSNPHHIHNRAIREIENGAELPPSVVRAQQDQSASKNPNKRSSSQPDATGGFNNENRSPNFGTAPPSNRVTQSNPQNSQFPSPSPQTAPGRDRGRHTPGNFLQSTSPSVSPPQYHSAAPQHSVQHHTKSVTQREMKVMPSTYPTPTSSESKEFPNDPPLTGRTARGGYDARRNGDTTSYPKEQMTHHASNASQGQTGGATVSVGKMNGNGFF